MGEPDQTLLSLAQVPYRAVVEADQQLGNKGGQVLSAMAFLTAAAAAIFASANAPNRPETRLDADLGHVLSGVTVSALAFMVYLFLVVLGAALHLAALGPSLSVTRRSPGTGRDAGVQHMLDSWLHFASIASVTGDRWQDLWAGKATLNELEKELARTFVQDTYRIAQRSQAKNFLMTLGREFFRFALLALNTLAASLFASTTSWFWYWAWLGCFGLSAVFAVENWQSPPRGSRSVSYVWGGIAIVSLLALEVSLFLLGNLLWLGVTAILVVLPLVAIFWGVLLQTRVQPQH